jgi:hypothetical protein
LAYWKGKVKERNKGVGQGYQLLRIPEYIKKCFFQKPSTSAERELDSVNNTLIIDILMPRRDNQLEGMSFYEEFRGREADESIKGKILQGPILCRGDL